MNDARWRVDMVRGCAEHLGSAEAAPEKEAIAEAIELFHVEPARRNRIVVQKVSGGRDKG